MKYSPIFNSVLAESTMKIPMYCSLKQMLFLDDYMKHRPPHPQHTPPPQQICPWMGTSVSTCILGGEIFHLWALADKAK